MPMTTAPTRRVVSGERVSPHSSGAATRSEIRTARRLSAISATATTAMIAGAANVGRRELVRSSPPRSPMAHS
jgi:hypothetical protein